MAERVSFNGYCYTFTGADGRKLGVGQLPGRKKLALYIETATPSAITPLAYFNSEDEAAAMVEWLRDSWPSPAAN